MTKQLLILRHAKAVNNDGTMGDHDRPLSPVGKNACRTIGTYMQKEGLLPEALYSSTASRAKETADLILPYLGNPPLETSKTLYLASAGELLAHINRLDNGLTSAMFVGHNPGIHQIGLMLTGQADSAVREQLYQNIPTASLLHFRFEVADWSSITPASGVLVALVTPRGLA
jgi:phosphohistidine phosphatase